MLNPSFTFKASWKIFESKSKFGSGNQLGIIGDESMNKIKFVSDNEDFKILYQYISPEDLEQKFGGTYPNLHEYWYFAF